MSEPETSYTRGATTALAVAAAGLVGVAAGLGFWSAPAREVRLVRETPASLAPAEPKADAEVLELARAAGELEPRVVRAGGKSRPATPADLTLLRAHAVQRWSAFLDRAPGLLDSSAVSFEAKRVIYRGVARLRLLDRMLLVNALPQIDADRALGRTFRVGAPPGLDLERHALGQAPATLRFRQIGVEMPSMMKDILEVSTSGQDQVNVSLSTPPSALKWAAVRMRTQSLDRRDLLWVTLNELPLMLDDRCLAARAPEGWVLCHFVDPALLRTTGNVIEAAHEPLPGAGSASILRLSHEVGIVGSTRSLR